MALAPKIAISLAAPALVAGGGALCIEFGSLIYFDMLATAFAGCFL